MKKTVLLFVLFYTTLAWGVELTGSVKTESNSPVVGAVVSDGYSVVTTNSSGSYSMPYNASAKYVFVSVPSGYDFPVDETGFVKIWQTINHTASTHSHNFVLNKQTDGGKADSCHVLLVIGDPQALDEYCLWRFQNETVKDIIEFKNSYPAGTKFIGLTVGDVVWDKYGYFTKQKANYESMGFPNFMVIGNHDHNASASKQPSQQAQDSVASLKFEEVFGPTYYSFNVGAIHYVVLDNVYYKGYNGGGKGYDCALTEKEKNWLRQDIAQLKKGTQVVYAMHIIATNNTSDLTLMQQLVDSLDCTNYIMSGHVHTNSVTVQTKKFIEHNVAACQGSYWSCNWCADGAPNGYKVFETSPTGIANWYYKGTGWDKDFRITTFPMNSINAGNNRADCVLANIWDYDNGGTVKILENGTEKSMIKFTADAVDPDIYDLMYKEEDTRPNYPGSEGGTDASKNPGFQHTKHIFYYKPKVANSELEVVFTDRFGKVTTAPVLRHMMVASFSKQADDSWAYDQNFNSLPSYPNYTASERRGTWVAGHTPKGWYAATSNDLLPTNPEVVWSGYEWLHIDNGSQNKASIKSFGYTTNLPAQNGTERSLGSLNTSTQQRICYGVIIENNTGSTINALNVRYTGEVWRVGDSNKAKENLHVSYAVLTDEQARKIRDRELWIGQITTADVPALTFTTPDNITAITAGQTNTAIDGNDPQNQKQVNGVINLTLAPGQVVLIRWDDDLVTSSADQALAIDDVHITPGNPTGLQENKKSLRRNHAQLVWMDNQVQILTEEATYMVTGQQK